MCLTHPNALNRLPQTPHIIKSILPLLNLKSGVYQGACEDAYQGASRPRALPQSNVPNHLLQTPYIFIGVQLHYQPDNQMKTAVYEAPYGAVYEAPCGPIVLAQPKGLNP
jgi:hypothetical protein